MRKIEINCDMGEGFGLYKMGDDEALMEHITVANIACGFHASDPMIMEKTVLLARKNNVRIGAHPSLPDLQGFGRREMKIPPEELRAAVIYQVGALQGFLNKINTPLNHVKPHGSLYGMAARDEAMANAICDAIEHLKIPFFGMANSCHESICKKRNIPFIAEFYADLDYDENGNLVITREHDEKDPAHAAKRVAKALREGVVDATDGTSVSVYVESICVHSDTPNAVDVAIAVKKVVDDFNKEQ
jgi:5-oxoprolinase (ATP-hydrolysing) subunit A